MTGGQLPDKGYREIARRVAGRVDVRLSRVVPGLARQLNHYRLVVSMAGYNACTELYQASTRGIVLPRFAPDFAEQMEQARKFQKAGAVDWIVDADATTPTRAGRRDGTHSGDAARPTVADRRRRGRGHGSVPCRRRRAPPAAALSR